MTSSNLENVLKRSILHDLSKTSSEKSDTLWIIEVQIFQVLRWYVTSQMQTPHTCLTSLDDKNIRYIDFSSKYNSIATLAHRVFIPVEFGPKWWRHQPSFWAITPEEMNQFRFGFHHLISTDILYPYAKYEKQVDMWTPRFIDVETDLSNAE